MEKLPIQTDSNWSFGEMSVLCSNLAKGCEKQYRPQEAEWFSQLAGYFESKDSPVKASGFSDLADLIQKDLTGSYPPANEKAATRADRGALRALVWSEKVTKILKSLLARYDKKQAALLDATRLYVCEICGFVYIGDEPPGTCPICKVPSLKIQAVDKEAV